LAFGQDEEISGPRGANNTGKYLEQEYGRNGIVDEGGMSLETGKATADLPVLILTLGHIIPQAVSLGAPLRTNITCTSTTPSS